MNQQIKAALSAVKDFLAGRSGEANVAALENKETRDVVAAELLTAMSGTGTGETTTDNPANMLGANHTPENSSEQEKEREQERARQLFLDHGYFDEAVHSLGAASSPVERAAAARSLGLVGSPRATAHLIAAMFDDHAEVRNAAEEALIQIGVPSGDTVAVSRVAVYEARVNEAAPTKSSAEELERPIDVAERSSVLLEAREVATASDALMENPEMIATPESATDLATTNSAATREAELLLREEQTLSEAIAEIVQQIQAAAAAFEEAESEAQRRTEREAELRAEAMAQLLKDEELRKRAEETAEVRRTQEREAMAAERAARLEAQTEAQRYADEETNLRLKAASLRLDAAGVARRRADLETARQDALEADLQAEARRARNEARSRHEAELQRLHGEVAALEAEISQQVETQLRLLEETRRRGQQEQERLQEEIRLQVEEDQRRLEQLEAVRTKAEVESKQQAEKEQQILSQIDSLRIADAETRRRIADADVKRRAADDAYRLIAEKVQRVEAEAHASAQEEERMRGKLESELRNAAIEAQSRADQEKRIREEIERFRRLEEEERPRLEAATLQLAEAEARVQKSKDRLDRVREAAEARALAEEKFITAEASQAVVAEQPQVIEKADVNPEPASPDEISRPVAVSEAGVTDEANSSPAVMPAIATYLNSVDPYKRAAAVAELARSGAPDAFGRIVNCFDDHSPHVRNAAARALRKLEPERTVDMFNRALEAASADRRRNIGAAIAASGLATEAINNLASENREETYNALSILFVMAKTGEVEPLVRALEVHRDDEIGKAVSKLLTLSGHRAGEKAAGAGAKGE